MTNPVPATTLEAVWGANVAERRKALRLSQRQLGEMAFTTQQTIWKIERGLITPRDSLKIRLAQVLGCKVGELFPWGDE